MAPISSPSVGPTSAIPINRYESLLELIRGLDTTVIIGRPKLGSATTSAAEVKQPAGHLHHQVIKAFLDVAKDRGHDLEDLDATQGVFHANPFLADGAIVGFLFGR